MVEIVQESKKADSEFDLEDMIFEEASFKRDFGDSAYWEDLEASSKRNKRFIDEFNRRRSGVDLRKH